jgi:hypothetical protein
LEQAERCRYPATRSETTGGWRSLHDDDIALAWFQIGGENVVFQRQRGHRAALDAAPVNPAPAATRPLIPRDARASGGRCSGSAHDGADVGGDGALHRQHR